MVNTKRGEVEIELGGKTYKVQYTFNALCDLEQAMLDKNGQPTPLGELLPEDVKMFSFNMVRALIYSGIHKNAPRLTIDDVGEMVGETLGTPKFGELQAKCGEALSVAFGKSFQKREDEEEAAKNEEAEVKTKK